MGKDPVFKIKGGQVSYENGGRVKVHASLKKRLSGMVSKGGNVRFTGRINKVTGSGKKDEQQIDELVEIVKEL